MYWTQFGNWYRQMEGSSDTGWRKPVTSRGVDTSTLSEPNLRLLHASRLSLTADASQISAVRRLRDPSTQGPSDHLRNRHGAFGVSEEEVAVGPIVRSIERGDVSLRQWLDNPERAIDLVECLHIFRQIVEIVSTAHSQGVVLNNVRPSCFVMSSFNHVAFIESASCSDSGSDEDGLNSQHLETKADLLEWRRRSSLKEAIHVASAGGSGCPENAGERKFFPMKELLLMETSWYTSPEEIAGAPSSCASDIYRLGVLLFELFCTCSSIEDKSRTMSSLRHRVLPPELLLKWPKEASFCLLLLHPDPCSRPKMGELLQSDFLSEPRDDIAEREAAIGLRERIQEQELVLEFLLLLKQTKLEAAKNLQDTISFLSSDIEDIANRKRALKEKAVDKPPQSTSKLPPADVAEHETLRSTDERTHGRQESQIPGTSKGVSNQNEIDKDMMVGDENMVLKNSRLMKNFKKLESAYFSTRQCPTKVSMKTVGSHPHLRRYSRGPVAATDKTTNTPLSKDNHNSVEQSGWVSPFLDGLCKYLAYTKLRQKACLMQADLLGNTNLVCSVNFDRDGQLFATAGVNKKIKVFECDAIMNSDRDIHYPVVEMASTSKLSSVSWNCYIKSQIASSNFQGVVQVWDATRSQVFTEFREHESRVWSVDFSSADPTLLASGSDDCSVKLWSINQASSIGTIRAKANVCCVQFPPNSGRSVAFGSADHRIYYYDLRNPKVPLCTFLGHNKTVSYIKFIDPTNMVSASTDSTLKLWDLTTCSTRVVEGPQQSFTGHTNVKNFVGLSVSDGYIATGSETNEVFIYHKAFSMPTISYKFDCYDPLSGKVVDDTGHFISSVCWRGQSSVLVAANSSGDIKLLEIV